MLSEFRTSKWRVLAKYLRTEFQGADGCQLVPHEVGDIFVKNALSPTALELGEDRLVGREVALGIRPTRVLVEPRVDDRRVDILHWGVWIRMSAEYILPGMPL